jgi:hypothetical protein
MGVNMEIVILIIGLSALCFAFCIFCLFSLSWKKALFLGDSRERVLKNTSSKTRRFNTCNEMRVLNSREIEEEMVAAAIATVLDIQSRVSKRSTTQLVNHHSTSLWRKKSKETIPSWSRKQSQRQLL